MHTALAHIHAGFEASPLDEGEGPAVTAFGVTATPASMSPGNPPRTTDTRLNPACINCSATRALVASSGQVQ